jgi:hypothetical protein
MFIEIKVLLALARKVLFPLNNWDFKQFEVRISSLG